LHQKTVLISLSYGLVARNIFRTDVLKVLREYGVGLVAVCPAAEEEYIKAELEPQGVKLVLTPHYKRGLLERFWRSVTSALMFCNPFVTRTRYYKWLQLGLAQRRYVAFILSGIGGCLFLHRSRRFDRICEYLDMRLFTHPEIGNLFDTFRPDLYLSTDLFDEDSDFIREAKLRNIPTYSVVKSWDNLTSKTRIFVKPDKMLVWSPLMKREAVELHHFDEKNVILVGAPQFDIYAQRNRYKSRVAFLESLGIDPAKKLILYSPGIKFTFSDVDNLRLLREIVSDPSLGIPCHIHVRKYPKKQQDFSALERELGITTENAGKVVPSWKDRVDQSAEEFMHLADLIYHTDLLIQFCSTIPIDAFCLGVPAVGYNLDRNNKKVPFFHLAKCAQKFTHNRYLVDMGGVRVVETPDELKAAVKEYLLNPDNGKEGRQKVIDRIIWRFDGKSGRRIATEILRALKIDLRDFNDDNVQTEDLKSSFKMIGDSSPSRLS